ncbi:MAG: hypothetical protein F4Y91_02645 [Gemmatimonadetes bacterium]|nr:hypothetical protein [Gemmatimonadota bacterium]MXY80987.1 hypothetical protein [Gemmatimonadota bacterium]MYB67686.1 hypothetical protein [Gemmatimonadota bacterium]
MEISLDLPDTAALVDLDQAYLKEALVVTLYHVGKLSEKEACLTLGISRRAFEELLPQFGFSILADTPETIDVEEVASVLEHQEGL